LLQVDGKHYELRPVFVLDPWFVQNANVGVNRWRFLVECLQNLDDSLKKLGLRLYVLKGNPLEVFERIFKSWKVRKLTFETDIEPYAKERDQAVMALAAKHKVVVFKSISHTLYDLEE
jgi:cryptochrome